MPGTYNNGGLEFPLPYILLLAITLSFFNYQLALVSYRY